MKSHAIGRSIWIGNLPGQQRQKHLMHSGALFMDTPRGALFNLAEIIKKIHD